MSKAKAKGIDKDRSAMVLAQLRRRSAERRHASAAGGTGLGAATQDEINAAAVAMNNALIAHGYRASDMALYEAFQADVGLKADGYPGTATMTQLKDVLFAMGIEIAPVPVYPWSASGGGYDGVNAPTAAQWYGSTSTTVVNNTSTTTSTTTAAADWTRPLLIGAAIVAVAGIGTAAVVHANKSRTERKKRHASHSLHPTMPLGHRPAYT